MKAGSATASYRQRLHLLKFVHFECKASAGARPWFAPFASPDFRSASCMRLTTDASLKPSGPIQELHKVARRVQHVLIRALCTSKVPPAVHVWSFHAVTMQILYRYIALPIVVAGFFLSHYWLRGMQIFHWTYEWLFLTRFSIRTKFLFLVLLLVKCFECSPYYLPDIPRS